MGILADRKGKLSYEEDSARQEESIVPQLNWEPEGKRARACFSGDWRLGQKRPAHSSFEDGLAEAEEVVFCFKELGRWDSSLPVFLRKCIGLCEERKLRTDWAEAPGGLRKLLAMSRLDGVEEEVDEAVHRDGAVLARIGLWTIGTSSGAVRSLSFIGEAVLCLGRWMSGRSRMRWRDLFSSIQACGAEALPIVTLVSFLTGLTMAFVGGVQLEKFAAQIYVADLVGLAMVREMGALMVAIVMAGRTGAAFAAELGNMKVSEEIDSLRTLGISPFDFLVLPRVLALFIMIPLLVLYADLVGIIGGMVVGVTVMDFSVEHYLSQTEMAIDSMWEVYSGLIKGLAFGTIIGMVGCYKGIRCGNSSAAVGRAVTSAVVTSITLVVVADALFEVVFSLLGLR
ncbi:MAG: ABC transporter permease [Opitutales bacterium]